MNSRSLDRRQFTGLCATSLLSTSAMFAAPSGAFAQGPAPGAGAAARRTVKLPDGTVVPALGQGSAHLGKGRHPQAVEQEALRTGISLGMTLIDTAEIYGSEQFISRPSAGHPAPLLL